jgi:hypothetical protein
MTTQVVVDAKHWPIRVLVIHKSPSGDLADANTYEQIVQPETSAIFHVWDTCSLQIEEMPQPVKENAE